MCVGAVREPPIIEVAVDGFFRHVVGERLASLPYESRDLNSNALHNTTAAANTNTAVT